MSFNRGQDFGRMQQMMQMQNAMRQQQQMQDLTKLQPQFQDTSGQQAMQRQMLQGLGNAAQMVGQRPQGGFNPMMMAQMLRGSQNPYLSSLVNMARYGSGNVYGGFGQGQVPTTTTGMD